MLSCGAVLGASSWTIIIRQNRGLADKQEEEMKTPDWDLSIAKQFFNSAG
jgi:hypothetical protein